MAELWLTIRSTDLDNSLSPPLDPNSLSTEYDWKLVRSVITRFNKRFPFSVLGQSARDKDRVCVDGHAEGQDTFRVFRTSYVVRSIRRKTTAAVRLHIQPLDKHASSAGQDPAGRGRRGLVRAMPGIPSTGHLPQPGSFAASGTRFHSKFPENRRARARMYGVHT